MKHIISVTVENKFGVLARVSGLFSSRGYNIDSLTVGVTTDPDISRMTIVVRGDDRIVDQVMKQLDKLIDVIEVRDLPVEHTMSRDLCLLKIRCVDSAKRTEILELVNIFDAKTIDVGYETLTVQITGTDDKIDAFIKLMKPFGIIETARTGIAAMAREFNDVARYNREWSI